MTTALQPLPNAHPPTSPVPPRDNTDTNIALCARIAQHYFASTAPALGAELRALLRDDLRLDAIMGISMLLPPRVRRLLWGLVAAGSARARIVRCARRYWGMMLSAGELAVLGGAEAAAAEAEAVVVWERYRAVYAVLARLARAEYDGSRQGWNVLMRDVRIVLRLVEMNGGAAGAGGVLAVDGCGRDGGARYLGRMGKVPVVDRVVEVVA